MQRKLTAILCADVHGYSRLMGDEEEATVRTLASHRKIIDSLFEQYHGRFVNSAGDSVLAEFASVVNAVQCARRRRARRGGADSEVRSPIFSKEGARSRVSGPERAGRSAQSGAEIIVLMSDAA